MSFRFSFDFISIIILVYLMIDAPKNNKNPILWGILGFFLGPIALAVYLFKLGKKKWAYIWLAISLLEVLAISGMLFVVLRMFHI